MKKLWGQGEGRGQRAAWIDTTFESSMQKNPLRNQKGPSNEGCKWSKLTSEKGDIISSSINQTQLWDTMRFTYICNVPVELLLTPGWWEQAGISVHFQLQRQNSSSPSHAKVHWLLFLLHFFVGTAHLPRQSSRTQESSAKLEVQICSSQDSNFHC